MIEVLKLVLVDVAIATGKKVLDEIKEQIFNDDESERKEET